MASEQPAGWSKPVLSFAEGRLSSAAAASEEAKLLCSVRRASKRRENKAGGPFDRVYPEQGRRAQAMLFQHSASRERSTHCSGGNAHLGGGFRMLPIREVPGDAPGC